MVLFASGCKEAPVLASRAARNYLQAEVAREYEFEAAKIVGRNRFDNEMCCVVYPRSSARIVFSKEIA